VVEGTTTSTSHCSMDASGSLILSTFVSCLHETQPWGERRKFIHLPSSQTVNKQIKTELEERGLTHLWDADTGVCKVADPEVALKLVIENSLVEKHKKVSQDSFKAGEPVPGQMELPAAESEIIVNVSADACRVGSTSNACFVDVDVSALTCPACVSLHVEQGMRLRRLHYHVPQFILCQDHRRRWFLWQSATCMTATQISAKTFLI
jgi:hypothetical protein